MTLDKYIPHSDTSTYHVDSSGDWRSPVETDKDILMQLEDQGVLGSGTFGEVALVRCRKTNELLALKRVIQDHRYINRELDVLRHLKHPNTTRLVYYFISSDPNATPGNAPSIGRRGSYASEDAHKKTDHYLYLLMEYVPETLYRYMRRYTKERLQTGRIECKIFAWQLLRSVSYLHHIGITHRDIKPQNVLVNPDTLSLKLCDYGSAKQLENGKHSVSYICSRFYRAPELMLGCTDYSSEVDLWSVGCVIGELLLGCPLFVAHNSVEQLAKVVFAIGTPTYEEMKQMNPLYSDHRFPTIARKSISQYMAGVTEELRMTGRGKQPPRDVVIEDSAIELMDALLKYIPGSRISAHDALQHRYFDEIRCLKSHKGIPLDPVLRNWTSEEKLYMPRSIIEGYPF